METTNFDKLKSDLKRLKIALIILTVVQIVYFGITFWDAQLWITLDFVYKANYIIGFFHLVVAVIFVWFNWKKMPVDRRQKRDNTYMILLLGIIGMWLWLPNEEQIDKLKR